MSPPFPPTWIRLLLDKPGRMEEIARACPELGGCRSSPDAFPVVQGVLARLSAVPPAAATLAACFGQSPPPAAGAVLDLSGGNPASETRRGTCSPNAAENAMARDMAAAGRMVGGEDQERDEPALARVRAVVRVALRAAPHALAVVIPEARASFSPEEFIERCGDVDDMRQIPGRTALTAYEVDQEGRWIQTQGNVLYAIPDVGLLTTDFSDPMAAADLVHPLDADMKTWGYAPPDGETVRVRGEPWRVSREGVGVWLEPPRVCADETLRQESRHANYQASFAAIARKHLGAMPIAQASVWRPEDAAPRHRIDVMLYGDGSRVMSTNGVGVRPRPGYTMEQGGALEIYATVARDGSRIAWVLNALAEAAHRAPAEQPFHFFDRMPFPESFGGIAGVVLAPRFELMAMDGHRVVWCLAVPITTEELDRIRAGAHSGEELVKALDRDGGWDDIRERWTGLLV